MEAAPLSVILSIVAGLALAAAAGFRAFVPLLVAGLAFHFGYAEPAAGFSWLGEPPALIALTAATAIEIAAYYVPGVDHFLDVIGAPVAIAAGIVAAAGVMVGLPDWLRWAAAVGAGGTITAAGYALNAIGRAKTAAATAGAGNPVYATGELAGSVAIAATAVLLPLAALALAVLALVLLLRRRRRRAA